VTGQSYSRDARYIAQKAETYLKGTAAPRRAILVRRRRSSYSNDVRYGQGINYAFHEIDF